MSAEEFAARVDRLLTRAHELFPVRGGAEALAVSEPSTVAHQPSGLSALGGGAARADNTYERAQSAAAGLDFEASRGAAEGGEIGTQGCAASGVIRDDERRQAAALLPMAKSPAGMQLLVATMGQHVSAMQRQLEATTAENRVVAARLRQSAAGYRQIAGIAGPAKPDTLEETASVGSPRPAVQMTGYGVKPETPSLPGGGAVPLDGGSTPPPVPPPGVRPQLPLNHWSGHEVGPQPVQSLPPAPPAARSGTTTRAEVGRWKTRSSRALVSTNSGTSRRSVAGCSGGLPWSAGFYWRVDHGWSGRQRSWGMCTSVV